jgi:replicative DNA helicase
MQAWTGMKKDEIKDSPDLAMSRYLAIRDRLIMKDIQEKDLAWVDAYIGHIKPDVVIIDQLDKVNVSGSFNASHERLRELYRQAREMAKRHNIALIGMSQASADAEGRTRLDFSMMEGSKTGKAAEADLIIGIGKHSSQDDDEPNTARFLNISKNKLGNFHGVIACNIEPEVSRYVV